MRTFISLLIFSCMISTVSSLKLEDSTVVNDASFRPLARFSFSKGGGTISITSTQVSSFFQSGHYLMICSPQSYAKIIAKIIATVPPVDIYKFFPCPNPWGNSSSSSETTQEKHTTYCQNLTPIPQESSNAFPLFKSKNESTYYLIYGQCYDGISSVLQYSAEFQQSNGSPIDNYVSSAKSWSIYLFLCTIVVLSTQIYFALKDDLDYTKKRLINYLQAVNLSGIYAPDIASGSQVGSFYASCISFYSKARTTVLAAWFRVKYGSNSLLTVQQAEVETDPFFSSFDSASMFPTSVTLPHWPPGSNSWKPVTYALLQSIFMFGTAIGLFVMIFFWDWIERAQASSDSWSIFFPFPPPAELTRFPKRSLSSLPLIVSGFFVAVRISFYCLMLMYSKGFGIITPQIPLAEQYNMRIALSYLSFLSVLDVLRSPPALDSPITVPVSSTQAPGSSSELAFSPTSSDLVPMSPGTFGILTFLMLFTFINTNKVVGILNAKRRHLTSMASSTNIADHQQQQFLRNDLLLKNYIFRYRLFRATFSIFACFMILRIGQMFISFNFPTMTSIQSSIQSNANDYKSSSIEEDSNGISLGTSFSVADEIFEQRMYTHFFPIGMAITAFCIFFPKSEDWVRLWALDLV